MSEPKADSGAQVPCISLLDDFPPSVTGFARSLAKLCADYGLSEFNGIFRPNWRENMSGEISFSWESGRQEHIIHISSTKRMHMDIRSNASGQTPAAERTNNV